MKKRMILDTAMLMTFLLLLDYRFVHNRGHEILGILFSGSGPVPYEMEFVLVPVSPTGPVDKAADIFLPG